MDNKLVYIPNDIKQNYPFCRFKLLVEKLSKHIKFTQSFKKAIKKMQLQNFGYQYNLQSNIPSLPDYDCIPSFFYICDMWKKCFSMLQKSFIKNVSHKPRFDGYQSIFLLQTTTPLEALKWGMVKGLKFFIWIWKV